MGDGRRHEGTGGRPEPPHPLPFRCTNLTDDGVKQLATLKNLTVLDLPSTKISDTGLMELSAIPGLAHLCVAGTNVSEAGVKEFERRNPKCDLSVPSWQEAIKR